MNKDELKQYRERIGLNQGELSKALGVANNTVSRWELGQRSIPEFLPLALETIERRLSTVGSESKTDSTVGSIDNKSTVGSSELSKTQSAPKQKPLNGFEAVKAEKKRLRVAEKDSGKVFNNSILEIVNSSSDNDLLSTVTVAERLNVSRKSVNDYIISGKLPAVKGKGNHNFIRESDLLEFIAQRGKE
jgi:excisionase family DNA binding protein